MSDKTPFQLGRVIRIVLTIALVLIIVNDVGRYLVAYSKVYIGARDAADAATKAAVAGQDGSAVAAERAASAGVTLDAYSLTGADSPGKLVTLSIQTSTKVPGMVVIGPMYAISWKWPMRAWWKAEPVLTWQDVRHVNLTTGGYVQ